MFNLLQEGYRKEPAYPGIMHAVFKGIKIIIAIYLIIGLLALGAIPVIILIQKFMVAK